MKKVPKYIKDKCKRMEKLCMEAYMLKKEVEKWCENNGIDTDSEEWNNNVVDEIGGCPSILCAEEIEEMLNQDD